jgi:hypothetical protein
MIAAGDNLKLVVKGFNEWQNGIGICGRIDSETLVS